MAEGSSSVDSSRFRYIALLQDAPRNNGRVELAEDTVTGRMVAIKAMPSSWACESHEAFMAAHPEENEQPWRDISISYHLSKVAGLRCVCEFVALFQRQGAEGSEVCMAMSYCAGGDLFSWLERSLPAAGVGRETVLRPLMQKVMLAVSNVHVQGVAHGDLSLENVLLKDEEPDPEVAEVRVIDFGASTGARAIGPRGKPSYQAPELHTGQEYDAFLADAFSVGVMIFILAVGNYPWKSTRPNMDPIFSFAAERGLPAYLQRRKINCGGGVVTLANLLSPQLVSLLTGMLSADATTRLSVSQALEHPWLLQGPYPS